ncbi:MAG TPA: choice-of-anchor tandem repeat GloVer-containing protein [Verrucomicrobiae bacterium]
MTLLLLLTFCGLCQIARADVALQVLYTFPTNAVHALGTGFNLVEGVAGDFYGTTSYGGSNNCGAVFRVTTAGAFTNIFSFNGTNGYEPGSLVNGNDGFFYGTTVYGGTNYAGASTGNGTIFKITTNGVFTSLFSFKGTNGSFPRGPLALGSDGNFYGITEYGGNNYIQFAPTTGSGTIFKITTNGALTSVFSFSGTNGASPSGGLALGNDGLFYGTTFYGETNSTGNTGNGTVFEITTNGVLNTLFFFNGTNGADPALGLALGSDGLFYGTTVFGGTNYAGAFTGNGTVFKITTNGDLTTLVSFNGTNGYPNGYDPQGYLTQGSDGNFYGTTLYGGNPNPAFPGQTYGTIFRVTTNGALTTLTYLNGTNGSQPYSQMVLGSDGNLYSTLGNVNGQQTINGGTFSRLVLPSVITALTPTNNSATLSWASFSNGVYRVEYSSSLTTQNWMALATNTATGNTTSFTDTSGSTTQRYYRIRLLP